MASQQQQQQQQQEQQQPPPEASSGSNRPASAPMSTAKFQDPKFVSRAVNDYVLNQVGFDESAAAKKLRLATAQHPRCRMMGDPTEAAFFKVLLPAINAKRIVEVGVFTGYTTLVMAQAIGPEGKIYALDVNEEFTSIGVEHWKAAGVDDRIDLRIAPAVESLEKLLDKESMEGTIDFAFIDADKVSYMKYYELLLRLVRKNGIIAIDNVLWSGRVVDESIKDEDDPDTAALRQLSKYVHADDRVEHVLLPFADGVTLVRKK